MSDVLIDRIRDANPLPREPQGPPIDVVWLRVEQDGVDQLRGRAVPRRRAVVDWVGRGAVLVSLVIALVVGGAAVLLLSSRHTPVEMTISAAPAGVSAERAAIDVLGALRRPQTKADLPPGLVGRLRSLPPLVGTPILPLVRFATVAPWGPRIYLVPLQRPTHRQIEQWAARTTGPRNRAEVANNLITRLAQRPAFEGVGLYPGGISPASTERILSGQAWITAGQRIGNLLVNEVLLIVPDGVSKVSITLPKSGDASPTTLSSAVHNNVVALTAPEALENLAADRITWYSASGAIVKPRATALSSHRVLASKARARSAGQVPPALLAHYAVLRDANRTGGLSQLLSWLHARLREMNSIPDIGQLETARIHKVPLGGSLSLWVIPAMSGMCVATETPSPAAPNHPSVGTHCENFKAALTQGVLSLGQQASGDPYRLSGVVPDGNSSVVAHFHSGATTTLPVTDNGVDAYLPSQPRSVTFRDAAGREASVPFG